MRAAATRFDSHVMVGLVVLVVVVVATTADVIAALGRAADVL